jgi:hypothetical protein
MRGPKRNQPFKYFIVELSPRREGRSSKNVANVGFGFGALTWCESLGGRLGG